jgi:hypothetical protein
MTCGRHQELNVKRHAMALLGSHEEMFRLIFEQPLTKNVPGWSPDCNPFLGLEAKGLPAKSVADLDFCMAVDYGFAEKTGLPNILKNCAKEGNILKTTVHSTIGLAKLHYHIVSHYSSLFGKQWDVVLDTDQRVRNS